MRVYSVKKGDTLGDIARNNNTTVDNLVKLNGITDPNFITVGQQIKLDDGSLTKSDSATTGGQNVTLNNSSKWSYDPFNYDAYKESDVVTEAKNALDTQLAQKPGAYQSQWQTQLNDTINKILNREKFSYDLNGDALYQQYKDKYTQQAKMAMGDAIGQASAMTGGYGNSYAQSVGQQMYAKEMQNLNDIVPELHDMAYDKYLQEGQDLYNQYSMLGTQEEQDYGRYRDSYSDWLSERDYLANRYDSERDYDYSKYNNERDFAYGQYSDDRNLAYTDYRNNIADAQWQKEFDETQRQFNQQMALKSAADDTQKSKTTVDPVQPTDPEPAKTKTWKDFSQEELEKNQKEYGGSYYSTVLNDLKGMKTSGKSNAEVNEYLKELRANSLISQSEYQTLYNKYRDNNLK